MTWLCTHSRLGFCWWDVIALIVLIIVIVNFVNKNREMKNEKKELEDKISELYADDTVEISTEV